MASAVDLDRRNPFTPSFGVPPPLLAGRAELVSAFGFALDEGAGSPRRAMLLTGARGMGKTVTLRALEDEARARGWLVISETATEGLLERINTDFLPRYLAEHDPDPVARRISGVELPFRGGGWTTSATDRHQPQPTLRSQLERLTDVLAPHETGVLITVDEVHRAQIGDLRGLAATFQHAIGERRDVALVAAGLPAAVRDLLNDDVLTFLRRAEREQLGTVDHHDVADALHKPILRRGRQMEPDALRIAAEGTQGYPFLVQLVGYHSWNAHPDATSITPEHARVGVAAARRRVGQLVHETSLADLSDIDRTYLAAMSLDDGPSNTRDIATRMDVTPDYANAYRRRLIAAELITTIGARGKIDFALPGLREYLRDHAAAHALTTADQNNPSPTTERRQQAPPQNPTPPAQEPGPIQ